MSKYTACDRCKCTFSPTDEPVGNGGQRKYHVRVEGLATTLRLPPETGPSPWGTPDLCLACEMSLEDWWGFPLLSPDELQLLRPAPEDGEDPT